MEGTNSAGDYGFASSLNYQHRNIFRGSELFSARVRGAYEALSGNKANGFGNYWELGAEGSLLFPRFLFPFLSSDFRRRLRASTEAKISYNLQNVRSIRGRFYLVVGVIFGKIGVIHRHAIPLSL